MNEEYTSGFTKPLKVKPEFYAHVYLVLKEIAMREGYALMLHGSMDRDLDLVAVPWNFRCDEQHERMIHEFCRYLGGHILKQRKREWVEMGLNRISYVINIHRNDENGVDQKYYLDIAVFRSSSAMARDERLLFSTKPK